MTEIAAEDAVSLIPDGCRALRSLTQFRHDTWATMVAIKFDKGRHLVEVPLTNGKPHLHLIRGGQRGISPEKNLEAERFCERVNGLIAAEQLAKDGFPYSILVIGTRAAAPETSNERFAEGLIGWLEEFSGETEKDWRVHPLGAVGFKDENAAFAFKMRWG